MEYNLGSNRASDFTAKVSKWEAKREADLKLRAQLLPDLHDTRFNDQLKVSVTILEIKTIF